VDAWVNRINKIYNDYDLLDQISKNGHELINNNFNLSIFNQKLEELLYN